MTRQPITLMPETEKWFDNIIGELRKNGIKISVTEFTNYVAWKAQKWIPDLLDSSVTPEQIEEVKEELEGFRAVMKAYEETSPEE